MSKYLRKMKAKLMAILAILEWVVMSLVSLVPMPNEGFSAYALRIVHDTRGETGSSEYTAPVMMVISGIIWIISIPIYVDAVQDTNTTGWTFTGATGATTLFLLMPFIFIAGGVVWILKKALK